MVESSGASAVGSVSLGVALLIVSVDQRVLLFTEIFLLNTVFSVASDLSSQ